MRRLRIPRLSLGCARCALVVLVCTIARQGADRSPTRTSFPDIDDHFKYGSIGTEERVGLPYWIWQGAAEGLRRQAAEAARAWATSGSGSCRDDAPHCRPIGTSYKPGRVARVGLNCATCHVGTFRETPTSPRQIVSGMPANQMDLQGYANFLTACAQRSALQLRRR